MVLRGGLNVSQFCAFFSVNDLVLLISCFVSILIFLNDYLFCHNCVFQEHEIRPAASDYIPGKDSNHDKLHEGIFLQSE